MAQVSATQLSSNLIKEKDLLTIKEASLWASKYLGKPVSESNISYLIQYGKVKKYINRDSTLS